MSPRGVGQSALRYVFLHNGMEISNMEIFQIFFKYHG